MDRTVTDFGSLPIGDHQMVVAKVTNTGGSPATLLGVSESCARGVCYSAVEAGPQVLSPGQSVDIVCLVKLTAEGPLAFPVDLYLDNGKFDPVSVEVKGIVTPGPEAGEINKILGTGVIQK